MVNSMQKFMKMYRSKGSGQRLGQFFSNTFIKKDDETTKDLFNCDNDDIAMVKINQWLIDNHHTEDLPTAVN